MCIRKYLSCLLALWFFVSITGAYAQDAAKVTEPFQYNDDNFNRSELLRIKAEHSEKWIRTHKPSPPSEVNVCYSAGTGAERAGIKVVSLRAFSYGQSDQNCCVLVKPDGKAGFSLNPQFGELAKLTKDKADELFGQDVRRGCDGGISFQTYQFVGQSTVNSSELEMYHIDLAFKDNGAVSQYRVRCAAVSKSEWHTVR